MRRMYFIRSNSVFVGVVLIICPLFSNSLAVAVTGQTDNSTTVEEYCQWEMLNASCPADQVLVFTGARYGRMQIGRCVTKNYGFIGCSVDVFVHLNTLCSGRHSCRFLVPDETLREVQPCPKDFASYLRVSYHCVTVVTYYDVPCYAWKPIRVAPPPDGFGHIASIITDKTGRGSSECPWLIAAAPGQRLRFTLFDFAPSSVQTGSSGTYQQNDVNKKQPASSARCEKYAVLRERQLSEEQFGFGKLRKETDGQSNRVTYISFGQNGQPGRSSSEYIGLEKQEVIGQEGMTYDVYPRTYGETLVCGDGGQGTFVYASLSNEVEIVITAHSLPKKLFRFVLRYDVIGCATLRAPLNGWLEETDLNQNTVAIGCNDTMERRYMKCVGTRWTGNFTNCTQGLKENIWITVANDWSSPIGFLLVSVIGIVLGVMAGTCLLLVTMILIKSPRYSCLNTVDHTDVSLSSSGIGTLKSNDVMLQNDVTDTGTSYGSVWLRSPSLYAFKNTVNTTRKSSRDSSRASSGGTTDAHLMTSWCAFHHQSECGGGGGGVPEQSFQYRIPEQTMMQCRAKNHVYEIPECRQVTPQTCVSASTVEMIPGFKDIAGLIC